MTKKIAANKKSLIRNTKPKPKMSLIQRFVHLSRDKLKFTDNVTKKWKNFLSTQYQSKERYYHNLNHLMKLYDHYDHYVHDIQDPIAFECSIWFHDLIYDVSRKDNELKSSEKFLEFIEEGVSGKNEMKELKERVKFIIDSTASHIQSAKEHRNDLDLCLFLDFDLSILSIPLGDYEQYSRAVYDEYKSIYSRKQFVKGRLQFLESFIQEKELYFIRKEWEVQARRNIQHEIKQLQKENQALS